VALGNITINFKAQASEPIPAQLSFQLFQRLPASSVQHPFCLLIYSSGSGSAIALAFSRRLPTSVVRVRARSGHVRFVVDTMALGQVFSEYFGSPCQSSFHQILHPHSTIGPLVAGRRAEWTQLQTPPPPN
jgi:hypothetical protein